MTEKDAFFYKGSFYATIEEWAAGVQRYDESRVSHTSLAEMMSNLLYDLDVNLIQIRRTKLNNNEMQHLLEMAFRVILGSSLELEHKGKTPDQNDNQSDRST